MNLEKLNIHKNSNVLFIYPHPDDETYFNAGLIQNLVEENINTKVLCLTQGEASSLKYGVKNNDLGEVRKKEFDSVMKFLKVSEHKILNLEDGNLDNENSLSRIIAGEINLFEPDIVLTFEPNGIYGHRDHVLVSKIVTALNKNNHYNLIYSTISTNYKSSHINPGKVENLAKPIEPNVIFKLSLIDIFKKVICFKKYKSQVSNKRLFQIFLKPYFYNEYYYVKEN